MAGRDNSFVHGDDIDLSKLSTMDYIQFVLRTLRGTPGATMLKVISSSVAAALALFAAGWYSRQYSEAWGLVDSPQAQVSNANADNFNAKLTNAEHQLNDINEKLAQKINENNQLQSELFKKPSYSTCYQLNTDASNLLSKKEQVENTIQWLLNPTLTKEQYEAGLHWSVEQLTVFVKQAAEYRKKADDIEREYESVQTLRKQCG